MAIEHKRLGKHGVFVSNICLGTMNFGWHTAQEESFKIMDRALELGINFFDTADVYGRGGEQGDTEEILGRWFAQGGGRRDAVILATKVFNPVKRKANLAEPNTDGRSLSAYKIRKHSEGSLKRLQTDHIDLYQMGSVATLQVARDRLAGCSSWPLRYAPELERRLRQRIKATNDSWRVDETYVRVKGKWVYLYRAVDSTGSTIDFLLSAKRDAAAAERFLTKALDGENHPAPRVINTDKHAAYPPAIVELKADGVLEEKCRRIQSMVGVSPADRPSPVSLSLLRRIRIWTGLRSRVRVRRRLLSNYLRGLHPFPIWYFSANS
jgi:hypothetical protein